MMVVESSCLPVTALVVLDGVLFYADGPCIRTYDGSKSMAYCVVNDIATVRVIRKVPGGILCAAGKTLFKCSKDTFEHLYYGQPDWIADLMVTESCVYIASAHGTVTILNLADYSIAKRLSLCEYALFYSAHFIDHNLVAFGTIFSGLWIYKMSSDGLELVARLDGHHRGSIFAITSNSEYIFSGSDDRTIAAWDRRGFGLVRVLKGHDARVWSLHCTKDHLVSGSEDGTVRLWSLLALETTDTHSILHEHQGKHVWSVFMDHHSVYSGGGDGAVLRSSSTGHDAECKYQFDVKMFHQTADNVLFYLNSQNVIMKGDEKYYENDHLRKFCVFTSTADWLVIGDLTGRTHTINRHTGRVSIMAVSDCKLMRVDLVVSRHLFVQDAKMAIFMVSFDEKGDVLVKAKNSFDRIVTSIYCVGDGFVLLGTRCGWIMGTDRELDLKFEIKVGADSVTGFWPHSGDLFQFCTRGGQLGFIDIKTLQLLSVEPNAPISYEGFLNGQNGQVCGFHDKQFVVLDSRTKQTLFKGDCGGGHRLWQASGDSFTYLRDSCLRTVNIQQCRLTVIKAGLSGLETRSIQSHNDKLVLAGEDGSLFVTTTDLTPLYKVQFDAACKSLCKLNDADGDFLVVGAKELVARVRITAECTILISHVSVASADNVRNMCAVSGGDCILVGCSDGSVKKYSLDLQVITTLYECGNCVMSMALSSDDLLYIGTSNGRLLIISCNSGELLESLTDIHSGAIMCMTTHQNAVICGGDDGHISIIVMRRLHLKWQAHNSTITGLLTHKDQLVSVSVDQRICTHLDFMQNHLLTPFTTCTRIPLTDASSLCLMPSSPLSPKYVVAGRGIVSLAAGYGDAQTCSAQTKRPRVA